MEIPAEAYQNRVVHYNITSDPENGIAECGFFYKPTEKYSQKDIIFEHYGAFLLLDGHGVYYDDEGYEFSLEPGMYVQRLPGRKHTTLVDPDGKWLEFFVCYGKKTYENMLNLGLVTDIPVIYSGLSAQIYQKCTYLMTRFNGFSEKQAPYLYLSVQEFAIDMFQNARNTFVDSRGYRLMCEAAELLTKNGIDFMTPQKAADALGMSYEQFRKKFKAVHGISPGAYQMNVRINESKTLLLDRDKTVNEIALMLGFSDGFAYSKAFKKRCGISPKKFREKLLKS